MRDSPSPHPSFLQRTRARRLDGQTLRLVAFGSSTTEGHGASSPSHTYPSVLRTGLLPCFAGGIDLVNLGIGGETAIEMDARLDTVVASGADLIIWQTGSNDATRPIPLERFVDLTRSGIARLSGTGADLVLVDQQYSRNMESCAAFPEYLDALHRLASEAALPIFPRHARMRAWCDAGRFDIDTLSPDGTHMADAGYQALGEDMAAWLLDRTAS